MEVTDLRVELLKDFIDLLDHYKDYPQELFEAENMEAIENALFDLAELLEDKRNGLI